MHRELLQTWWYGPGYHAGVLTAGLVLAQPGRERWVFSAQRRIRLLENPITELELVG